MRGLQPLQQSLDQTSLGGREESHAVLCPGRCTHAGNPTEAGALWPACVSLWDSSCISLPPVPCYRKGCFTDSLLLHQLQGRKYFDAIKILLVFFTPSSSMQNRKAWHIAFYGYERSRWRLFVFSDNCAHNINTALPNCTLFKEGKCLICSQCISPGKTEPTTAYWTRPLNNQTGSSWK